MSLGIQVGEKERVDERGLAETGLADHHERELEALLDKLAVNLVGQVGKSDVGRVLRIIRLK